MGWMRLAMLVIALLAWGAAEARPEPAENGNGKEGVKPRGHLKDNSYLIEESYNQEQGVVQHIFNWVGFWTHNQGQSREFSWQYTCEIPIGSEKHQFSFQFPMLQFVDIPDGGLSEEQGGVGDMQLNYRYQLLMEDEHGWVPAVSPRVSLILPTGDKTRGLGNGEYGFQFNLPISKQIEPFAFHFNAGYTTTPGVTLPLDSGLLSAPRDLNGYNLGASVIWLVNYDFNLMLEWVLFYNEDIDGIGFPANTTEIIVNPAFRWAVWTSDDIQWVLGLGVPIGLSEDAPDIGVFGYMSVEHRAKKEKKNEE